MVNSKLTVVHKKKLQRTNFYLRKYLFLAGPFSFADSIQIEFHHFNIAMVQSYKNKMLVRVW